MNFTLGSKNGGDRSGYTRSGTDREVGIDDKEKESNRQKVRVTGGPIKTLYGLKKDGVRKYPDRSKIVNPMTQRVLLRLLLLFTSQRTGGSS